ncbi:DUF6879 family protein [Streptomyces specialis]|uniref:DUF6879 family protein n=1 Tax=Streptomyces specialis TaxID=498367 RepID=UPI00073E6BB9|nr:DUF6879 family protein [Streptomyces specialis]
MRLDGEDWTRFFDAYQHDAWRLETLPVYRMPGEREMLERFLRTGRLDYPEDSPWLARVRRFRASGRTIGRVHVLTRPLTDYLRFELAAYAFTSAAGEDIRILDLTDRENPGLPQQDFWMLDNHVVEMRYDAEGRQIGRFLLDNPDLEQYRTWKHLAVHVSVPLAEYREKFLTP